MAPPRRPQPSPAPDSPKGALQAFIAELNGDFVWYERSVTRHFIGWFTATAGILASGFGAAILAALATEESFKGFGFVRVSLVVLPVLGTALSSLLTQANLAARYRLREDGRRKAHALLDEAKMRYAAATEPKQFSDIYEELRKKRDALDEKQAKGFFDFIVRP